MRDYRRRVRSGEEVSPTPELEQLRRVRRDNNDLLSTPSSALPTSRLNLLSEFNLYNAEPRQPPAAFHSTPRGLP
jgi:hypothetical protein